MLTDSPVSAFSPTFSLDSMTKDLTLTFDRPSWILSCYGPAKNQPTIIRDMDESMEELRVKAVQATRTGAVQEYVRHEMLELIGGDIA